MKELFYDYENLDNLDIDEEISKIDEADVVNIRFNQTNKRMLFLLGVLFAANKKIKVTNFGDLNINAESKSYDKMVTYWAMIGKGPDVNNYYDISRNNIFLICPVRNATEEQIKKIKNYISNMKVTGLDIHYPEDDTNQKDPVSFGYRICSDNSRALGYAGSVQIFYDQKSTGTVFDIGMAYYFNKQITIINKDEITFRDDDFIDNMLIKWLDKQKQKEFVKR